MDTCNYTWNRGYEVLGETLTDLLAPCRKYVKGRVLCRSLLKGVEYIHCHVSVMFMVLFMVMFVVLFVVMFVVVLGHVHGHFCLFHGELICISNTVILFLQTTCE